jgi:hypothetical protein
VRESRQVASPVRVWGDFAVAAGIGLLLGLLVSFLPVASIALIVAMLVLAAAGLIRRDSRRSALAAGALVGSGGVYVYGAINTTLACLDDRCGGADPWPLVLFAVAVFGFGLVTIALSLVGRR